jgi:hypothetical protein
MNYSEMQILYKDNSGQLFDASGQEIISEINGWTNNGEIQISACLSRLKYNRIISNFYLHDLKKCEGRLSWYIIVISSFSSVLSLANTESNYFPHSSVIIKALLVLFTLITTLLGAYIKKQQFIERINNVDRYLQVLNKIVEEINIGCNLLEPTKRLPYKEFCDKYIPLIKELSVIPDSLSPYKWKKIVSTITREHQELITVDGTDDEKLWPWYKKNKDEYGERSDFFKDADPYYHLTIESNNKQPEKKLLKISPFETDIESTIEILV